MEITFETILGVVMIVIGTGAFLFVIKAKRKFPEGSELKTITKNLIPVLIFLICFSLWHVLRETFHWKKIYGEIIEYPEYLFIILAYIMLFRVANSLYKIAKEFGITK